MMARWTTARAVEGGADLRLIYVSPTVSPVKERMGRVESWEVRENGLGEMGQGLLGLGRRKDLLLKQEEDKKEEECEASGKGAAIFN
ncbi:hypothetical protein MLD38_008389 [Melastoma candidum]|uniref:Uncharacterized protein n=1 Tax=Melastoma candidum TaxID=119954 RepID=A0ACB9RW14_9MYRT|nr:hypothetical protein MLD38_008389 [Melastoma candidum]